MIYVGAVIGFFLGYLIQGKIVGMVLAIGGGLVGLVYERWQKHAV